MTACSFSGMYCMIVAIIYDRQAHNRVFWLPVNNGIPVSGGTQLVLHTALDSAIQQPGIEQLSFRGTRSTYYVHGLT